MKVQPITIWRRISGSDNELIVEHNHIEDGHVGGIKPIGHASWIKYIWLKSFGYLVNHKVVN